MINKAYQKFLRDFRKLPERKQYIEFFTAILSIPVLLTVIVLNLNTLRDKGKDTPTENVPVREVVITQPDTGKERVVTVTSEPCVEEIGPISIDSPDEGERVTDNPVQVSITYKKGKYCAVVWSYRINGGRWSEYDDNSIALFNPPKGEIRFELRVKSIASGDQKTISRNFTYAGNSVVPTDTTASGSAN
jgi:hypothetical protein